MVSDQKLDVYGLDPRVSKTEWDAEPRPARMNHSARDVWLPRALSESRPEWIPPVRGKALGKYCDKVQPPG
jgi:hypothetical protein